MQILMHLEHTKDDSGIIQWMLKHSQVTGKLRMKSHKRDEDGWVLEFYFNLVFVRCFDG